MDTRPDVPDISRADSRQAAVPSPAAEQDCRVWPDQPSPEVRELTEIALGQALEAVVAERGPMTPFVVLERAGERVLGRFEGEPAAALARARAHVRESDADRAAVVWDGCLTIGGVWQEAVVVAASDRGRIGVVVAHRYRETLDGVVIVSRPVLVGPGAPVL